MKFSGLFLSALLCLSPLSAQDSQQLPTAESPVPVFSNEPAQKSEPTLSTSASESLLQVFPSESTLGILPVISIGIPLPTGEEQRLLQTLQEMLLRKGYRLVEAPTLRKAMQAENFSTEKMLSLKQMQALVNRLQIQGILQVQIRASVPNAEPGLPRIQIPKPKFYWSLHGYLKGTNANGRLFSMPLELETEVPPGLSPHKMKQIPSEILQQLFAPLLLDADEILSPDRPG